MGKLDLPELERCPACGSVSKLMPMRGGLAFKAMCRNIDCQIQTPQLSAAAATARWNARQPPVSHDQ